MMMMVMMTGREARYIIVRGWFIVGTCKASPATLTTSPVDDYDGESTTTSTLARNNNEIGTHRTFLPVQEVCYLVRTEYRVQ